MEVITEVRTPQQTPEGQEKVVIGRHGARMANTGSGFSVPIWTTKVYRAVRRQSDGLLSWRLISEVESHSTSGNEISAPMIRRATKYAEEAGVPYYRGHLINGMKCS